MIIQGNLAFKRKNTSYEEHFASTPSNIKFKTAATDIFTSMIEVEDLAECVINSMDREEFLILPHPVVLKYFSPDNFNNRIICEYTGK